VFLRVESAFGQVGCMYQGKRGNTSVCEQDGMISIYTQGACQGEIEASLESLNISSTLDIAQVLEEMGQYCRFPESQVLRWGESRGFFVVAERVGDSLSHRLALCGASTCFSGREVHGEFGVEDESEVCKLEYLSEGVRVGV